MKNTFEKPLINVLILEDDIVLANDPEEDGDMAYMICATEDESVYIEIDSYLEDDDAGDTWICIDYFIYEAE